MAYILLKMSMSQKTKIKELFQIKGDERDTKCKSCSHSETWTVIFFSFCYKTC